MDQLYHSQFGGTRVLGKTLWLLLFLYAVRCLHRLAFNNHSACDCCLCKHPMIVKSPDQLIIGPC